MRKHNLAATAKTKASFPETLKYLTRKTRKIAIKNWTPPFFYI